MKRFFMESSADKPDDGDYIFYGIKWLANQPEKAILYVPNADKIENSYLSTLYTEEQAKEFRKNMCIKFGDKDIHVIIKETIKPTDGLVNAFVIWADDHYDKVIPKIEENYNLKSILVLPWNPETDINNWKIAHNPTQLFLES